MLSSNIPGPVNIGNPDERSVLDIARDVIAATGSRSAITFVTGPSTTPEYAARTSPAHANCSAGAGRALVRRSHQHNHLVPDECNPRMGHPDGDLSGPRPGVGL